jgi:hypothetical protein
MSIEATSADPIGSSLPVCGSTPGFSLRLGLTDVSSVGEISGCELLSVIVGPGLELDSDGLTSGLVDSDGLTSGLVDSDGLTSGLVDSDGLTSALLDPDALGSGFVTVSEALGSGSVTVSEGFGSGFTGAQSLFQIAWPASVQLSPRWTPAMGGMMSPHSSPLNGGW